MQITSNYQMPNLASKDTNESIKELRKVDSSTALTTEKTATSEDRETFGLALLENMSDDEYDAFLRATKGMDSTKVERAGQTLQLVASAYENSQRLINGGLLAALNSEEPPSLMSDLKSLNVQKAINEGIEVLKQMNENDQRQSVRVLERMAMALTQSGLNLQG